MEFINSSRKSPFYPRIKADDLTVMCVGLANSRQRTALAPSLARGKQQEALQETPYGVHSEARLSTSFPPDLPVWMTKGTLRIYPRKRRLTPWEKFLNDRKKLTPLRNMYIVFHLKVNVIILCLFSSLLWPLGCSGSNL